MNEVTRILNKIEDGDPTAASQLLPLVYEDLKRLAAIKMADERPGQTLQATALVHDAYLRLVGSNGSQNWSSRGHFFAAAATSMRRILIENARKKQRIRHGGGRKRVDLNVVNVADPENYDFLDALDQAIDGLAEENPTAAQVVNLRFFAGLTIEQTAESLNVSVRTANRHWAYAKAWIYQQISGDEGNPEKT